MKKTLLYLAAAFITLSGFAQADLRLNVSSGGRLRTRETPIELRGYSDAGIVAESAFNFEPWMDTYLVPNGINLVRVWLCYHFANDLTPFAGTRATGYDLLTWNPAYWARLQQFVAAANARNIAVQVTIFDAVAFDTGAADPRNNRWVNNPYNNARNSTTPYLTNGGQFDDVPSAWWSAVNVRLIRKLADTLGPYGNVIYELVNEPNIHSIDTDGNLRLQQQTVTVLSNRLAQYNGSKIISVNLLPPGHPKDFGMRAWALAEPRVKMVSFHINGNAMPSSALWNGISKPVIISNDGHNTMSRSFYTSAQARANAARSVENAIFGAGLPKGRLHLEFLDKDLNGSSWTVGPFGNYNPRPQNTDVLVLNAIKP